EANTMASLPLATKQRFNTQRKNIGGGIVYITSTKAGEESYEYPNMGAVFSHYFLRGIKGEADRNGNKTITIKELFDFLETNVSRATNNKQVPQINREGYRDIPFIVIN
ncbi:MAG: caspase family protein, partial [Bacteroidota bacterium]